MKKRSNNDIKRLIHAFAITAIFLFMLFPILSEICAQENQRLTFIVKNLDGGKKGSMMLNPEVENVTHFQIETYRTTLDGNPVFVMDKEDFTDSGYKILWRFYMEPKHYWLIRMEKRILDKNGKPYSESWYDYRNSAVKLPPNLCHLYSIVCPIMVMNLKPGEKKDLYILFSEDSSPWHIYLVRGQDETVRVPSGEFRAMKLFVEPDYRQIMGKWFWAHTIINQFVPAFNFWVSPKAPHSLIRFEGRFGPVGATPLQAYELSNVETVKREFENKK